MKNYDKPYLGATFRHTVYSFELTDRYGRCVPGNYAWRVSMADPYRRYGWDVKVRHGFRATC
jgi:hypothetical protein